MPPRISPSVTSATRTISSHTQPVLTSHAAWLNLSRLSPLSLAVPSAGLKYNYPLGAGLIALMPLVSVEPSDESIARWCGKLGLPASRLQSDYAFFKDAQQKMAQAQQMLMEMAAASKRKEAKKLLEDAEKAAKEAAEAEAAASAA